jgi:hypothetical protein
MHFETSNRRLVCDLHGRPLVPEQPCESVVCLFPCSDVHTLSLAKDAEQQLFEHSSEPLSTRFNYSYTCRHPRCLGQSCVQTRMLFCTRKKTVQILHCYFEMINSLHASALLCCFEMSVYAMDQSTKRIGSEVTGWLRSGLVFVFVRFLLLLDERHCLVCGTPVLGDISLRFAFAAFGTAHVHTDKQAASEAGSDAHLSTFALALCSDRCRGASEDFGRLRFLPAASSSSCCSSCCSSSCCSCCSSSSAAALWEACLALHAIHHT